MVFIPLVNDALHPYLYRQVFPPHRMWDLFILQTTAVQLFRLMLLC